MGVIVAKYVIDHQKNYFVIIESFGKMINYYEGYKTRSKAQNKIKSITREYEKYKL